MKFKVDKDAFIGCGACQAICEDVFEITDDGYATAKDVEVKDEDELYGILENYSSWQH